MPDLWEERLLPFLLTQGLTDEEIDRLGTSKLRQPIADWNVDTVFKWLKDAEILTEMSSFLVFYPRICHAVLFSIGLLWDSRNNELLNVTNNTAWSQVKFMVRASDGTLETRECAMNNPSFFFGGEYFWLIKRPYNTDVELHSMATEWGNWCLQRAIKLPTYPYKKDLVNMHLDEACLFLCIEHACLMGNVRITERDEKNERPKRWQVEKNGAYIFPPYFYTADAETTWNTLTNGNREDGTMVTPWHGALNDGDGFVDLRTFVNTDNPSHKNWQSEIEGYTSASA
jgi:hypothetical protein